jgi:hypothetical protein
VTGSRVVVAGRVLLRLACGALGGWLGLLAVGFLLRAVGLVETDTEPWVFLPYAVLTGLAAGALLWFAAGRTFAVWAGTSE